MNIHIYLYIHIYEYISIWFVDDFTKLTTAILYVTNKIEKAHICKFYQPVS